MLDVCEIHVGLLRQIIILIHFSYHVFNLILDIILMTIHRSDTWKTIKSYVPPYWSISPAMHKKNHADEVVLQYQTETVLQCDGIENVVDFISHKQLWYCDGLIPSVLGWALFSKYILLISFLKISFCWFSWYVSFCI